MNQQPGDEAGARFGEVTEASSVSFTAQCYQLYDAPHLGSLVRCGDDGGVYGIVCDVATQSIDPSRPSIPRGESVETEEDVYRQNPQLSRLLSTQVQATAVGYRADGRIIRFLSPLPPRIHSFAYACPGDEVRRFSSSLDFMPLLLAAPVGPPDDVIAGFLRQASAAHPDPGRFLVDAGRTMAVHLGGEIQRLNHLLRRLSP